MKKPLLCLLITLTYFCLGQLSAQTSAVDNLSCSLPCLNKNFNVRVVMTIDSSRREPLRTEEQVQAILREASTYFEPICVSLSNCDFHVIQDNYTYNSIDSEERRREMKIVYSYPRRVTILFVNKVTSDDCGYSEYRGLFSHNNAHIFVALKCSEPPALQIAHHMGRLLGLKDTNADNASELVDGSNCATAGDCICDTPADPYRMTRDSITNEWKLSNDFEPADYYDGCEFISELKDDNGDFFSPKTNNIMSSYPCKCSFTPMQFLRMVDNIQSTRRLMY